MIARCLCCGGPRAQGQYVCDTCWRRMPQVERLKLRTRDGRAGVRLLELAKQLQGGVPPEEIRISA